MSETLHTSPSVLFIRYVLRLKPEGLNRKQISEETGLPDRTIGWALKRLLDAEIIERKRLPLGTVADHRKRTYVINNDLHNGENGDMIHGL